MEDAKGVDLFCSTIGAKLTHLVAKLWPLSSTLLPSPAIAATGIVPFCFCVQRANISIPVSFIRYYSLFACGVSAWCNGVGGLFSWVQHVSRKPRERKSANYPLITPQGIFLHSTLYFPNQWNFKGEIWRCVFPSDIQQERLKVQMKGIYSPPTPFRAGLKSTEPWTDNLLLLNSQSWMNC